MATKVYYDSDANLDILAQKTIAIIGYGSQGHAHALNLKDSGCKVVVGLAEGSPSWKKALAAGLEVNTVSRAVKDADVVMCLVPDERHGDLFKSEIEPNLKGGAYLAFGHGFSVHFGQVVPHSDINVMMIAPKGPGHLVRSTYSEGGGGPA